MEIKCKIWLEYWIPLNLEMVRATTNQFETSDRNIFLGIWWKKAYILDFILKNYYFEQFQLAHISEAMRASSKLFA